MIPITDHEVSRRIDGFEANETLNQIRRILGTTDRADTRMSLIVDDIVTTFLEHSV